MRNGHKLSATVCAFLLFSASHVMAHAADQGFVLLLPTDIYITAGVAAFCLTVILVAMLPDGTASKLFRAQQLFRAEMHKA